MAEVLLNSSCLQIPLPSPSSAPANCAFPLEHPPLPLPTVSSAGRGCTDPDLEMVTRMDEQEAPHQAGAQQLLSKHCAVA